MIIIIDRCIKIIIIINSNQSSHIYMDIETGFQILTKKKKSLSLQSVKVNRQQVNNQRTYTEGDKITHHRNNIPQQEYLTYRNKILITNIKSIIVCILYIENVKQKERQIQREQKDSYESGSNMYNSSSISSMYIQHDHYFEKCVLYIYYIERYKEE